MALIVKSFIQSQRESSVDPPFWVKPKNLIKSWWNSVFGKSPCRETISILSHQVPTTGSWYSCLNSQWALECSADKESCVDNATRYHKESCVDICASSVDPPAQTTVKSLSKKSCPVKTQKNVSVEGKQLKPGTTTSTVTVQPASTVLDGRQKHQSQQKVVDYSATSGPSKRRRRTKCKKVAKPVCIVSVPKKEVRDKREIGSGHVVRRH